MRGSRSFFLMVTVVGFAAHIGNAFVYYGTPSLELEVIRAHVILRGRVTRVNLGGFADGYESIGFRISEVLKGNYTTQSEITVSNPFWSTKKNEWKKGDSDAIVFLTEERGIPRVHYLLSMKEPDERVIYCSDFRRLSDPDEILEMIRSTAKMKLSQDVPTFSASNG